MGPSRTPERARLGAGAHGAGRREQVRRQRLAGGRRRRGRRVALRAAALRRRSAGRAVAEPRRDGGARAVRAGAGGDGDVAALPARRRAGSGCRAPCMRVQGQAGACEPRAGTSQSVQGQARVLEAPLCARGSGAMRQQRDSLSRGKQGGARSGSGGGGRGPAAACAPAGSAAVTASPAGALTPAAARPARAPRPPTPGPAPPGSGRAPSRGALPYPVPWRRRRGGAPAAPRRWAPRRPGSPACSARGCSSRWRAAAR